MTFFTVGGKRNHQRQYIFSLPFKAENRGKRENWSAINRALLWKFTSMRPSPRVLKGSVGSHWLGKHAKWFDVKRDNFLKSLNFLAFKKCASVASQYIFDSVFLEELKKNESWSNLRTFWENTLRWIETRFARSNHKSKVRKLNCSTFHFYRLK